MPYKSKKALDKRFLQNKNNTHFLLKGVDKSCEYVTTRVMAFHDDVWDIINGEKTSTTRDERGETRVRDSARFIGISLESQNFINDYTDAEMRGRAASYNRQIGGNLASLREVREHSAQLIPCVINNFKGPVPLVSSVRDSIYRSPVLGYGGIGGIDNTRTMSGVYGQDPNSFTRVTPNVWLSPYEAAAIYSQKGLPETIINKKSKSILLNGLRVKNPRLKPEQLDKVHEQMIRTGYDHKIAEALTGSLVYGGGLLYPMYKRDNPATMHLPIHLLAKYGIIGKGKLSRWVVLDRWNTVHIPNWNPTTADFQNPKKYYIPFLGADVSGERCSRIVTAPQPGYYGVMLTMGWGLSDIPGWIKSVFNYYNVMEAIPAMIRQMSIIIRTFEVEAPLATEGLNMIKEINYEDTIHRREISENNLISMDVIGKIQAIQRDFKEVPALLRLMRQDVGGMANIAEELLFSSERGAFSSGDTTEGAMAKLWENNKYIHKDVAHQLQNSVQLLVIDALGLDREVLAALPYTTIEFDNPSLTDAGEKSTFFESMAKAMFDASSAQIPMDQVAKIALAVGGADMPMDSELMAELKQRQQKMDAQEDEKFEKEMKLLEAQIEQVKEQTKHVGEVGMGSTGGIAKPGAKKGEGYTRQDQRKHEKTRGTAARREAAQKAKARGTGA
jgi:hypothetical protein